jgi:hypothetical protein
MGNAISGRNGKVMYGSVVLAGQVEWSMSGFVQSTVETTAFGDTVKSFLAADAGDPGTISFNGNYDPTDSTGQLALTAVCQAGTGLTNLYLYANTSTFWRVGTGGTIIVTKVDAVTMPRNGIGKINFEGQVSGAAMEQVGVGT